MIPADRRLVPVPRGEATVAVDDDAGDVAAVRHARVRRSRVGREPDADGAGHIAYRRRVRGWRASPLLAFEMPWTERPKPPPEQPANRPRSAPQRHFASPARAFYAETTRGTHQARLLHRSLWRERLSLTGGCHDYLDHRSVGAPGRRRHLRRIARAIGGGTGGGFLVSIAVGYIGALLGMVVADYLHLPELLVVTVDQHPFPILWSIIGAALFVAIVHLLSGTRRKWRYR